MKALSVIIAAAVVLLLQGSFAAVHATNASGHCTGLTVTDFVSSDATDIATSSAWKNVTDGHLNFTTSGTGCVVITFSGPAFAAANQPNLYATLHVRTLLDGNSLCVPAFYKDIFSEAELAEPEIASSITRICKNVAAGSHTVQVQYSGDNAGGTAEIDSHVLTVTHN